MDPYFSGKKREFSNTPLSLLATSALDEVLLCLCVCVCVCVCV
jgi:hypothetical protein